MTKAGPLTNFAISEQYPPGSTYKLVTGAGALQDGLINDTTTARDQAVPRDRAVQVLGLEPARASGPLDIYDGFGALERHLLLPAGGHARHRPAGLLGDASSASASAPASTCPTRRAASCPTNDWKKSVFDLPIYPGEIYQAGIGQGYDAVTPLQLLNAYCALANGGTLYQPQIVRRVLAPDGSVVRDFQPEVIRQLDIDPQVLRRDAPRRAPRA